MSQADLAEESVSLLAKREHALKGLDCAERCVARDSARPGCYYGRAIHRGLLLETRTGHYKKGLLAMIADFERAARLDPLQDGAGPWRALAYIYLKLPELPLLGSGLSRDLDFADRYALKALARFPDHPENLKLKGEIDFKRRNYAPALKFFKMANRSLKRSPLLSGIRRDRFENELKTLTKRARKNLKK